MMVSNMMKNQTKIRPIAIAIIRRNDEILVAKARDEVKKETFYRPLGGEIEFGESSPDCIIRELMEEIQADIIDMKLLTVLENIFVYEGKPGHEIVMVYEVQLADKSFYKLNKIPFNEIGWDDIEWKAINDFKSGRDILYPEKLLSIIS
jgi:8-oxo-dGTP pyrophosphatase MutT (NUDIX family)